MNTQIRKMLYEALHVCICAARVRYCPRYEGDLIGADGKGGKGSLGYRTPNHLEDALLSRPGRLAADVEAGVLSHLDALDLGCGTGLMGVLLRPHCRGPASMLKAPSWRCHSSLHRPPGTRRFGPGCSAHLRAAPQPLTPKRVAASVRVVAICLCHHPRCAAQFPGPLVDLSERMLQPYGPTVPSLQRRASRLQPHASRLRPCVSRPAGRLRPQ